MEELGRQIVRYLKEQGLASYRKTKTNIGVLIISLVTLSLV